MKKNRIHIHVRKAWSVLMVFCMILSLVLMPFSTVAVYAQRKQDGKISNLQPEQNKEIFYIKSASDMVSLSKKSHVNFWSRNIHVELMNDIDLEGSGFEPVPSFAGTFEGNGHTISGFDYEGTGYSDGLFRYNDKNGVIRNLDVEGNLTSQAEEKLLGGICGENAGTIQNCRFRGKISGKIQVGGIAGCNLSSGTITKCVNEGEIVGNYSIGGIAGENDGVITDCTNKGNVNDTHEWINKTEQESNIDNLQALLSGDRSTNAELGKDIGGIAGRSKGLLSSCTNEAVIGYEHAGYNVGGIAGRQSGVLSRCENHGTVYGRQDIGGIVGQAEPSVEIDEAESLAEEVNKLHDMVDTLMDDLEESSDSLTSDMDELQKYTDNAVDQADILADQATDFLDDNIDSINDLSARVEYIVDHLPSVMDNAESALDILDVVSDDMKEINDDMKQITDIVDAMDDVTDGAQEVNDELETSNDIVDKGDELMTDLENINHDLSGLDEVSSGLMDVNNDMKKINNDLGGLTSVMKKMDDIANDLSQLSDHLNLTEQMKDKNYEETDYQRITFQRGIGGSIGQANNVNPAENAKVTFVVTPDDGYKLKAGFPKIKDAKGNAVSCTVTEGAVSTSGSGIRYEFKMPKENVLITAEFDYIGEYVVSTNAGGTAWVEENTNGEVKLYISPDDCYDIDSISIGGYAYPLGSLTTNSSDEKVAVFNRSDENYKIANGKPKKIIVRFEKAEGAHDITPLNFTGCSYVSVSSAAIKDLAVTVKVKKDQGYKDDGKLYYRKTGTAEPLQCVDTHTESNGDYIYVIEHMPDYDIDVWVEHLYDSSGTAVIPTPYAQGKTGVPGGQITLERSQNSVTEWTVTLTPDSQYGYSYKANSLKIGTKAINDNEDGWSEGPNGRRSFQINDVSVGYGTDRIEVTAEFEKVPGTYLVSTTYGTGGFVSANPQTVSSGAMVTITAAPRNGYHLKNVKAVEKGTDTAVELKKKDDNVYTIRSMPAGDVEVIAEFEPVQLYLTSANAGGVASYTASGNDITVTVTPDSGFRVKGNPNLTDKSGNAIPMQKKYANSYVYEFKLDASQEPAHFDVTFEKLSTYDTVQSSRDQIQESSDNLNNNMTKISDSLQNIRDIMTKEDGSTKTMTDLTTEEQEKVLDNVMDLSEALSEAGTNASNVVSQVSVLTSVYGPFIEDAMNNANDDINRISDDMRAVNKQLTNIINDTNGDVNTMLDHFGQITQKLGDITSSVNKDMNSAVGHLKEINDMLGDMLENVNKSIDSALNALKTVGTLTQNFVNDFTGDVDKTLGDFDHMMEYIHESADNASDIVDYLNTLDSVRFHKLGDDFDTTCDNLYDELKSVSKKMSEINDNLSHYSDILVDDFRDVNDQLNHILIMMIERAEDAERLEAEGNLYEDVSEDSIKDIKEGKVKSCKNYGIIKGDINVGGMAGTMGVDTNNLLESSASDVEFSVGNKYLTRCLVQNCRNYGYVTSKKDAVGGIAGYMDSGVILGCEAYGTAKSTEGSYAGGIVGNSNASVLECSSMCTVDGKKYAGGIAGYGSTVRDCYSMAKVTSEEGRQGAIAGQISYVDDKDIKKRSRQVSGNYYVSNDLFGIDEISYIGVAEPLTYTDLMAKEKVPFDFNHLKITFLVEDEKVAEQEYAFGESLSGISYPEIPKKEGCYGEWPDLTGQVMTGNLVLEAEYFDDVTVLESVEKNKSKDAYAMVEGIFTEKNMLHAVERDMKLPDGIKGDKMNRAEEIIIIGNKTAGIGIVESRLEDDDVTKLRLLNPFGEDGAVYRYADENWEEVETVSRGRYLQTEMTGYREVFCVVNKKGTASWMIYAAAGGAVILLAGAITGIAVQRKKKNKEQEDGNKISEDKS